MFCTIVGDHKVFSDLSVTDNYNEACNKIKLVTWWYMVVEGDPPMNE